MTCQEVSSGRYAAECDDGYYYDEASYSCVEDTLSQCSSYIDGHRMCVLPDDGSTAPSLGCRSVWYGDECDDMYSVHIPDKVFRGKVCDAISNSDPLCDVSEFEMAGISGEFCSFSSHITSFEGAQSENDNDYWTFITTVFPIHSSNSDYKDRYYLPNSCTLNNEDDYVCDSETYPTQCPSIVLNEVYNSVDEVNEKQCAFIAKEGADGECFTVHDDSIRQYLKAYCLSESDVEANGIISVGTMRSDLTCSSLSLSAIVSDASSSISTLDELTTLQGLEYGTLLTSLTVDGYDLSGDTNSNSEYDRLVIQILAKAVTYSNSYGSVDSGLTTLSASGCNLSAVSDVLDLTPIADGDSATQPFKLTSLDLSDNSISDVSVLITSGLFPADTLTFLDISGNSICDIDAAVTTLQSYFTNTVAIVSSGQSTCPCSDSGSTVLFSSHKT
ncbi:hypothetical protein ADUPG1_011471, partial [Aduncisulcus paluster]